MPNKQKAGGPTTFYEWMVGTSISSHLGPIPEKKRKSKQRDIIRVDLTTDDESEEDTLRITYPRRDRRKGITSSSRKKSRHNSSEESAEAFVKRVRFDGVPLKSALKKGGLLSSESEDETTDSSTDSASDSSTSSKKSKNSSSRTNHSNSNSKPKNKKKAKVSSESSGESDSESTCKYPRCRHSHSAWREGYNAARKEHRLSESNHSTFETDSSRKATARGSKKNKRESDQSSNNSEADNEASESETSEEEKQAKKKAVQKKAEKGKKGGKKQSDNEKTSRENPAPKAKEKQPQKDKEHEKNSKNGKKTQKSEGNGRLPEPFYAPHFRRPNLIEPIRAEVVQTERVVETPEDPPPNAYYDAHSNIMRVYHGPVYGGQNYGLYPRRDPANRPLPIGTPHPTQNPYYYGFKDGPQQDGYGHVPVTQGMPIGNWNTMGPPPGYFYQGPPQVGPPGGPPGAFGGSQNGGNKGTFQMSGANGDGKPPSIAGRDRVESNNVGPGSVKENPYLTHHRSQFSGWGSNHKDTHGQDSGGVPVKDGAGGDGWPRPSSIRGSQANNNDWGNNQPKSNSRDGWGKSDHGGNGSHQGWNNSSKHGDNHSTTWHNGSQNNNGAWSKVSSGRNSNNSSNQGGGWNNGNNGSGNENPGGWNTVNQGSNRGDDNDGTDWGAPAVVNGDNGPWGGLQENGGKDNGVANPSSEPDVINNVGPMPGQWQSPQIEAWGDTTMAASTGGQVDQW